MKIYLHLLFVTFCLTLFGNVSVGQTIDVKNYTISLDISDFSKREIRGNCEIKMSTTGSGKTYTLDLQDLTVDSVLYQGSKISFEQKGEALEITWLTAWSENEERSFTVFYGGKPARDSRWGGFYFSGDYAFNLGVGFDADPHNYGRVWFPCNDVFDDRATYKFHIETAIDKVAMCNGSQQGHDSLKNGNIVWHWTLRDPIPTYLASVAVAPYEVRWNTIEGIPVSLAAVVNDTSNMYKSFENLPVCIDAFINQYGPHTFERIGFNLVPFNGGAMEHATNIAYPRFGAAGNKNYETLWAHELAHHWFGNTITCESQEHMWINEGWASFSERLFLEAMYGKERYKEEVSANHRAVLHYAHLRDGSVLPVAGIGHSNTYGSHVYDKGAEVAHTLRGYMGDSAFFDAIQDLMVEYKFKTVNTDQMQKHFQKYTSVDMEAFFRHWVYQPGFPHFDILENKIQQNGSSYSNTVSIRQRTRMAPERFDKVALELTFYAANWKTETFRVILNQDFRQDVQINTSFKPVAVFIDVNEVISDAITDKQMVVDTLGEHDFGDALMLLDVKEIVDSALVRIEHNWVSPDHYFNPKQYPVLSSERYWTVAGIWPEGFKANATIEYNGSTPGSSYPNGYLDNNLIRITEDSLVLMYRENAGMEWREYPDYEKITRTKFDKKGQIIIKDLKRGEYAFAMYHKALLHANQGPDKRPEKHRAVKVYPNPSDSIVKFEWQKKANGYLEVTDSKGRTVQRLEINKRSCSHELDVSGFSSGVYYVGLIINNKPYEVKPFYVK